jgi:hypothetical protein
MRGGDVRRGCGAESGIRGRLEAKMWDEGYDEG